MTSITWRTGRKVGRTIYEQVGPELSDNDRLIGVMDTPDLARRAVEAVNQCGSDREDGSETPDPPEAPVWLGHEEAGAWQGGWVAGYEAATGSSTDGAA